MAGGEFRLGTVATYMPTSIIHYIAIVKCFMSLNNILHAYIFHVTNRNLPNAFNLLLGF